ncbi:hypothetical protein BASA81_000654 [Batrachochytrium salamandrivorans]|nr:hypothetical protein BASA81_000654 [Batrachochytrium salamandrivorans]
MIQYLIAFQPKIVPPFYSAAPSSYLSPATFPTTFPPNTTFSPTQQFPIWDIPKPGQPVVSSFGDFQWTYPANFSSPNAYAQHRFTKNELQPCKNDTNVLCCTIGSSSAGGGQVGNGCGFRMDFMAEFEPIPNRPLFSLVDAMLAWQRKHPTATRMEILFIGDSVTGQVFTAAVCELARNSQVQSLTYNSVVTTPIKHQASEHALAFQESHVRLLGLEHVDFCILFIRQFRMSLNPKGVSIFLSQSDVIFFGWGLHYEISADLLHTTLRLLRSTLRKLKIKQRILIWVGALRRHFRFDPNNYLVEGRFHIGTFPYKFCGPVARFPVTDARFQTINQQVLDYVQSKHLFDAQWFKWNELVSGHRDEMYFYPFTELTSPFFRNHKSYNVNTSIQAVDCTHTCWAPNLFEPMWDALYLLMAETYSPTVIYPAGTRSFPNMINYTLPLRYMGMISALINEVL